MKTKGFLLALAFTSVLGMASASTLQPRRELAKEAVLKRPSHSHRLVVKFRDGLKVRARNFTAESLNGSDLSGVRGLLGKYNARLRPLIALPEEALRALEQRGEQRSGQAQPDLAAMMIAEAPDAELELLANALNASAATEFVYFEALFTPPPCTDLPPTTPSYVTNQTYRGTNPGINMLQARTLGSARGAGIALADCEYGFITDHEDLCNITLEAGQTPDPAYSTNWNHGTATLGEMVALDNAYGCEGLVTDVTASFYPEVSVEAGFRRVTAIAQAINASRAGDVVVLEMQTRGPTNAYCPAEYEAAVWIVVNAGTAAGVIIVAAAGNGSQDLDWSMYQTYMNRGDSGAIIVGAGTADTNHNKLGFSTYGARVNLQGWGKDVATLGYNNRVPGTTNANQRYCTTFNGYQLGHPHRGLGRRRSPKPRGPATRASPGARRDARTPGVYRRASRDRRPYWPAPGCLCGRPGSARFRRNVGRFCFHRLPGDRDVPSAVQHIGGRHQRRAVSWARHDQAWQQFRANDDLQAHDPQGCGGHGDDRLVKHTPYRDRCSI